jgi:hypothetical protein
MLGETNSAHKFVILKLQGKTNGHEDTDLTEVHKISCLNVGRSLKAMAPYRLVGLHYTVTVTGMLGIT